jgi:uncharacterized membrane protein
MTETAKKTGPRMSRKVKALLIGSLALNLVVAGLFVGAAFRHGGASERYVNSDALVRALDHEDRRAIGKAVKEAQGGGRKAFWEAQKEALQNVAVALRAEPFDAAALKAALAQKSAHLRKNRDAAEAAMLARFTAMSADERAKLADRLEEALARGPHKRKRED